MNPRDRGIVIAGGGTGGHLFPGIALAKALRAKYPTLPIDFIGTARGIEVRVVPQERFPLHLLKVLPLRGRGPVGALRSLYAVPAAILAARKLLQKLRPQVAIGVGGYAAGPALIAAKSLGIKTLVLEQNARAGITNRLLGRIVDRVLISQPSRDFHEDKVTLVGNPVRPELLALSARAYAPTLPPKLLVMGGSQGARALNRVLTQVVPTWLKQGLVAEVVHQTGKHDEMQVQAAYRRTPGAQASAFLHDMAAAYKNADFIICRAGASTLAEIAVCGLPSILVPFPSAADDHQTANAKVFLAQGAAVLLPESEMTPERLTREVTALVTDPARLEKMARAASLEARPNALADIVAIVESGVDLV